MRLPIGIQTFSELVDPEEHYIYIDKTEILHRLISEGKYYFLSRPRRFGKSVMLSTLYEIFSCNRELFDGLSIEDKWNWGIQYPVIRISFGSGDFSSDDRFDEAILANLQSNNRRLKISCKDAATRPNSCFRELIETTYNKYQKKTVILIDEYDKPILDHITDRDRAKTNRDKLKAFYSVIKDMDEYIRFVMITGVSKFSKMNLFSGLNNLHDITINPEFATICGYTHAEVTKYFPEFLAGVDQEKLKKWYNGYNYFSEPIYNPFDILLFFSEEKEYRPYWWSTGNPSFLIDVLKKQPRYLPDLENCVVNDLVLDAFDVDHIDISALLWQTGYLTFAWKQETIDGMEYGLKVPNREIQISLNNLFLGYLTRLTRELRPAKKELYSALLNTDMDSILQNLQQLFASIPYQNYANNVIQNYEGYYASVVYAYIASLGLDLIAEDVSSHGRVDLAIRLPDKLYLAEFKVDQPGKALEQIHDKGYHKKYLGSGRDIYLMGINFDTEKKNITEFAWEKVA